jgi:hypothetical protein
MIHDKTRKYDGYTTFVGDLIGSGKAAPFQTVCIPFSNKVWNYLSSFKDVRTFADALTGKPRTDKEFNEFNMSCMTNRMLEENRRNENMRLNRTAQQDYYLSA